VLLSSLRKPVDTFAPSLGFLYRSVRDVAFARAALRTRYGFTLAGDPRMADEDFESTEANAFIEMLDCHEAVIDIGANVGFYSCLAASRGKQVVCFEPSRRNLKYLYRNLSQNQFHATEVFPLGLAKQPGLNRLYGFGGIASFVPGWAQADKTRFEAVPVTSLDAMIADRFLGRKLLIKMDVEGFELDVLAGAERTLALDPKPTWLVEIILSAETIPGGTNPRFAESFELFWGHGYECKKLNGERDTVRPGDVLRWVVNRRVDDETRNFLFCGS
jgi:FkbM family methyltransferase